MTPRYHALWAEYKFRQKVVHRLYPDAGVRICHGNPLDMSAPANVLIVLNRDSSHGVYYDQEMSLLQQQIDIEMRKTTDFPDMRKENTKPWPLHDHKVVQMNQMVDFLVSCACVDETWEDDRVQDIYASMFNKAPLDRIVEALDE